MEAAVALRNAAKIICKQRPAQIWKRLRTVTILFIRPLEAVNARFRFAAITVVRATKTMAANARLRFWAIEVATGA
jgi:hypothetical protein